jgi:hypothetical protein
VGRRLDGWWSPRVLHPLDSGVPGKPHGELEAVPIGQFDGPHPFFGADGKLL